MNNGKATVYGLSSTVCFAGVVARAITDDCKECRNINGLFESMLALSFVEELSQSFG